jgi:hypothetical protein
MLMAVDVAKRARLWVLCPAVAVRVIRNRSLLGKGGSSPQQSATRNPRIPDLTALSKPLVRPVRPEEV